MTDEFFDRHYQEARKELNGAIVGAAKRLAEAVASTFKVLNRIEYAAPWKSTANSVGSR